MSRAPRLRRLGAAALSLALVGMSVAPAAAESALWSLVASPLTATVGDITTFSLTATNEDPLEPPDSSREIGCVVVDVPANFTVSSATVSASTAGDSWVASRSGNRVRVRAGSGGDRLELLQWVRFTVEATPLSSGSLAWESRAYRNQDCTGTGALLGVPPVVVVSGAAATPTPAPTLTPTNAPTPTPTPLLPLPSVLPSLPSFATPSPTPAPTDASTSRPAETARSTQLPGSSSEPQATPIPGDGGAAGRPPGGGAAARPGAEIPDAPAAPRIEFDEGAVDLSLGNLGIFGGGMIWSVPALTLGVPGLLILVWIGLQVIGAFAWIPAVRRLRGEDEGRPGSP